jgi:succinate-semialdehyde dehydrogenase/glutarate-semialdehyde dehydrogenase
MMFRSINPATGQPCGSHPEPDAPTLAAALSQAESAFRGWREVAFSERARYLRAAAELMRRERRRHAELMALEMGKPVQQGEAEAEKCAWVCEYYAEHAEGFLAPEPVETDAARSYVRFDPLGPVLAIMPWNFPFWQVFRFAAPALMAGNVGLLKHASNVFGCARAIEEVFSEAGLPTGVFQSLIVSSKSASELIDHPAVQAVTLTGSEPAGMEVAARAGRALKKTVLELGGSDPFIVLDDVDVAAVAGEAARSRTLNAGQSCIAAKRFIVMQSVEAAFTEALRSELEALRVGDPLDAATEVGPLAREDLLEELDGLVQRSVAAGARLVSGGRRLDGPGYFYAPTLLAGVRPGMPAAEEETFGPVAAVIPVASEQQAVEVANASRYGLGASIWSGDLERAERRVPGIEAGHVAVNGIVKSDPRLPFGGIKRSGYGRELAGFGIREFVNVKSVWIGAGPEAARAGR